MPVTSSVLEFSEQPDGTKSYTQRMYDGAGEVGMAQFYAPPGFDVDTRVAQNEETMDAILRQGELANLIVNLLPV